ncbi:hypothetical protein [Haloterrigena alkaliphila]|uniref:DUF8135 domain-containing protein n=1 Tax=Haloterrigena alkaliphila TaxID=2816475 RepID=A0A8A2VAR2_9EURY|nr:hypothetical protein [Haloterrigena alkaliphila]QSW99073.1 hypothetical protein J0X25_17095 [Haloterrigena alkaliphila]
MTDDDGPEMGADGREPSVDGPATSAGEQAGPLGDLAASVEERRAATEADGAERGSDAAFDDLFDREDVPEIDGERLWERLEADEPDEPTPPDDRDVREIEKATYCHQCEHFADPPAVACTREGTDILELTDRDRFRVVDCPVVLEDERLEERY